MNFSKYLNAIKEDADAYAALALGVVGAIIGVFGGNLQIVISTTSGVLTLLAFSVLRDRSNMTRFSKTIDDVETILTQPTVIKRRSAEEFDHMLPEVIKQAKSKISLLVRSGSTFHKIMPYIEEAVATRNCSIKILFCSDDEETVSILAKRGSRPETRDPNEIQDDLNHAKRYLLRNLQEVLQANPEAKIEIKQVKYVPSITLSYCDEDNPNGILFGTFVSFRTRSKFGPTIYIENKNNNTLYNYFVEQFERYWNADDITDEINI